jgi:hypothetical protein
MSSVVISGDTSGAITLAAPAIAGTNTLSLPAQTATIATLTTPSFATTIGVGGATAAASGAGITFPASQSASSNANTLDDYEEGTWTPTGNGITYSTAVGSYIKVGRMVMATFNVTFPSTADGSGAQIKSLPFTVTTGNSYQSGAYVSATDSSTAKDSNFTIGGTTLIFRDNTNSDVANSSFSTKFVQGTAMYFADA